MKIQVDLQQLLQRNVRMEAILALERSFFCWKKRGKRAKLLRTAEAIFLITGSKNKMKAMETLFCLQHICSIKRHGDCSISHYHHEENSTTVRTLDSRDCT